MHLLQSNKDNWLPSCVAVDSIRKFGRKIKIGLIIDDRKTEKDDLCSLIAQIESLLILREGTADEKDLLEGDRCA